MQQRLCVACSLKYLYGPLQKRFANLCLKHFSVKHVNIYLVTNYTYEYIHIYACVYIAKAFWSRVLIEFYAV